MIQNDTPDLSEERDLAIVIKAIRQSDSGKVSHQTLMIHLAYAMHEFLIDFDFSEIEVTDEEVATILGELPTSFDTEVET